MQQMRRGMVGLGALALVCIDHGLKSFVQVLGQVLRKMDDFVVFPFGVPYINDITIGSFQIALIPYLSAAFGIERGQIENELILLAVLFRSYFSVFDQFDLGFQKIIADEFLFR